MTGLLRAPRLLLFAFWAVVMTALTYVLGAPVLKVLRRRAGRGGYWALIALSGAAMFAAEARLTAVAFLSLGVLIGVFDEFEEMGFGLVAASSFTLLINALLGAGAFALWVWRIGPHWIAHLTDLITETLKPVTDLNPALQISATDLLPQLPSATLILWIVSLYLGVLLEGRVSGTSSPGPTLRRQLPTLRLPDVCVWVFVASLLGAFGGFASNAVTALAINALNVCVVLFFFQGIAVVTRFIESVRLAWFWQVFVMVLMVVYLSLFVSVLGLMDYWLDFRGRLEKRAREFNQEI